MEEMKYFLDTYAMLEIIKGNPKYSKYMPKEFYTSIFQLYELYYILLRDFDEKTAKRFYQVFSQYKIRIEEKDIFQGSELKLKLRKREVSYVDVAGYVIAKRIGARFLTGDKEFKDLENVEYTK